MTPSSRITTAIPSAPANHWHHTRDPRCIRPYLSSASGVGEFSGRRGARQQDHFDPLLPACVVRCRYRNSTAGRPVSPLRESRVTTGGRSLRRRNATAQKIHQRLGGDRSGFEFPGRCDTCTGRAISTGARSRRLPSRSRGAVFGVAVRAAARSRLAGIAQPWSRVAET
jgi:hypothetical protein